MPGQLLIVSSGGEVSAASAPSLRGLAVRPVAAGLSRVTVPSGQDERALAARIGAETGFVVQPNYIYRPLGTPNPNDPRLNDQYHLTQTNVRGPAGAWTIQTDGVKVAVIDTGVNRGHPDLQGRLEIGRDFCVNLVGDPNNPDCQGEDDDPSDVDGHGTHTVGIVGAATNNALGVAGVTQAGPVLVIKAFGQDAQGAAATTVSLAKSIDYAANNGAKVINLSLGIPPGASGSFSDAGVDAAIARADAKDVTLVAAAGNENGPLYYPASNPTVLAVGSVNRSDVISSFSARGAGLDLMAPGEAVLSTALSGGYEGRTGTSEAAPQVAAVAALIRAKNPGLTSLQTQSILKGSATRLGGNTCNDTYGCGRLEAGAALGQASGGASRTVTVFAARLVGTNASDPASYNPDNPKSGRVQVALPNGSRSLEYKITQSVDGTELTPGTYRVYACVNQNTANPPCGSGDLTGASARFPVSYTGAAVTGVDVVLTPQP